MIQVVAAITDQLHYMLERRSQENFLPTAKLQTSVNAIVNGIGYRPRRKVSSTGTLSLTLVDGNGIPIQNTDTITIPKYSKLTFGDDVFVNTDDITLLSTQVYPYEFTIKEGSLFSLTYDPSNISGSLYLNNYVEIEDYLDIENTSFFIYTATQTFTDVIERIGTDAPIDSLSFAKATDEVYDLNNTNNGLRILFGDGTSGEKPTGILNVKYIQSSGDSVAVVTTGNDFVFDDYATELIDVSLNTYNYTLTNTTTIDSGLNEETIDEVKKNAPSYVRTANRASSKNDYIFWVNRSGIGGIVDSNAYGEEEIGINVINANNVYIIYLTNDGLPLCSSELTLLDDYVDNYKIVTSQTIYEAATVIPLQIELKVKRNPTLTASNSEIYDVLKNNMIEYFAFAEGTLGKPVNHSEVVDHFHTLTTIRNGVTRIISDYVNVNIKALHAFSTPWESIADIDVTFTYGIDSDVYTILINDIPYTYTAQGGDTVTEVVGKIHQLISLDWNAHSSLAS
ncbi:baseplate J/gp47 family protein, partial [bacterium]|nr:baseplate J/gp47 family protein [bacterium]